MKIVRNILSLIRSLSLGCVCFAPQSQDCGAFAFETLDGIEEKENESTPEKETPLPREQGEGREGAVVILWIYPDHFPNGDRSRISGTNLTIYYAFGMQADGDLIQLHLVGIAQDGRIRD